MSGLLLILLCMVAGFGLKKSGKLPVGFGRALNHWVIKVALPALVFLHIHQMASGSSVSAEMWVPISMAWIQFFLAFICYLVFRHFCSMTVPTAGSLFLTIGLGNTSFVGFPLIRALFGEGAISTAVLVDQPGSFLVLSTLGLFVASTLSSTESGLNRIIGVLKKVVSFPPFIALVLGVVLAGLSVPKYLGSLLELLSSTLMPVALVSVGFQLQVSFEKVRARALPLGLGLCAKLILTPICMSIIYFKLLPYHGQISQVIVVESAMAPMITGGILASESGLDPELASLMVGVGIPMSLITVPLWAKLVGV